MPVRTPYPSITANMVLIQSKFGTKRNFEVVALNSAGGLFHIWRNNDNSFLPWSAPTPFGQTLGVLKGVSMIQSDFGSPGNLEVVCIANGKLQTFWRDSGPSFTWNGPFPIETNFNAIGIPAWIQSKFGQKGNFELVVPAASGRLSHFWRNNDASGLPWSGGTSFGSSLGTVSAVTMIQSNYGTPGNLEVVCIAREKLQYFWRDSGPSFTWNGPFAIESASKVTGNPILIQSKFGKQGNFELVVPAANGGLLHFWRNNDAAGSPWSTPTAFGQSVGVVTGATLIESNYGNPGNLEVTCDAGGQMQYFWRDSGPGFVWNGPSTLSATTW